MAVQYMGFRGPDGLCIVKDTSEKLAFFGSTPVDKPGATEDIKDALVSLGLLTDSGASPLNLDGGALTVAATATITTVAATDITLANDMTVADAGNIILATSTGTKIGTATTQKLAFYNATPIVQRTSSAQAAIATTAAISTTSAKWGYSTSTQANSIVTLANELRAALLALGLIKGS